MKKARTLFVLLTFGSSTACGTEIVRAVNGLGPDDSGPDAWAASDASLVSDASSLVDASGTERPPPAPPPLCSTKPKLLDRITGPRPIQVEDIRYKRTGYFYGFPQDERIAMAARSDNGSLIAWLDAAGTTVHVTPIAADLSRSGPDFLVEGTEVSGLVARDDGFALLTRRTDPGDPLDNGQAAQATYFVRYRDGREAFAVPLTGTKSISGGVDIDKRDYPTGISGRLAYNDRFYGAYFTVKAGSGDRLQGATVDKLVFVDDEGRMVAGGWRSACRTSLGTRLVPDATSFKAFCMTDGASNADALAGLNLAASGASTTRLAPETTFSGYAGGNLGSAIRMGDGYLVGWASRGVEVANISGPAYNFHEPVLVSLSDDLSHISARTWPFHVGNLVKDNAPKVDAVNVHVGPYGDAALVVWETIESPSFRSSVGFSTGSYGGTHFRLVDMHPISATLDSGVSVVVADGGTPVSASEEEVWPSEGIAPNGPDDIVRFPNGDLGWAFVPEVRDFQNVLAASSIPSVPAIPTIKVVRFAYCTR